jgi:hypothetical protein
MKRALTFADGEIVVATAPNGASRNDANSLLHHHQYDFGRPSTFSAMKLRISCGLIGAMRGISDSRK